MLADRHHLIPHMPEKFQLPATAGAGGRLAIAPTATACFYSMAKHTFGSYTAAFYPTAALGILGIIIASALLKAPKKA